jgi:hypothetical protein
MWLNLFRDIALGQLAGSGDVVGCYADNRVCNFLTGQRQTGARELRVFR